jgi:hypothetical protein
MRVFRVEIEWRRRGILRGLRQPGGMMRLCGGWGRSVAEAMNIGVSTGVV